MSDEKLLVDRPNMIHAPFTPDQVDALNRWQQQGDVHPFTCHNVHEGSRTLIAKPSGWECPGCEYRQYWAHRFMAEA